MPKQNDSMLDAAYDWIKARVTRVDICTTEPTTYTEATSTYSLGNAAYTSTQMTTANGDTSGRKVTMSSETGVSISTTGTAKYIALSGSTGATALLYWTTCTSQALTSGNTANIPSWKIEIADGA